jgi:hypothetical protein
MCRPPSYNKPVFKNSNNKKINLLPVSFTFIPPNLLKRREEGRRGQ